MAKHEAANVGDTAKQSGEQVMQTVGEQTKRVTDEAGRQARNLLHEGRQQLTEQAREGQQKTAQSLHALADQLDDMYTKSDGSGIGPEVVQQAAGHARNVASWLEDREPGDLLDEVRGFARRKPGVFLAGAAVAGILVGRLTRGVVAAQSDDSTDRRTTDRQTSDEVTDRIRTPEPGAIPPASAYPPPAPAPQSMPGYTQPPAPAYSQPPAQGQMPPGSVTPGSVTPGGPAPGAVPPAWNGPGAAQS
jgi:hypothetical protein